MEPVRITELNHAVLYVRDVPTAVGFYRDVLALQLGSRVAIANEEAQDALERLAHEVVRTHRGGPDAP